MIVSTFCFATSCRCLLTKITSDFIWSKLVIGEKGKMLDEKIEKFSWLQEWIAMCLFPFCGEWSNLSSLHPQVLLSGATFFCHQQWNTSLVNCTRQLKVILTSSSAFQLAPWVTLVLMTTMVTGSQIMMTYALTWRTSVEQVSLITSLWTYFQAIVTHAQNGEWQKRLSKLN